MMKILSFDSLKTKFKIVSEQRNNTLTVKDNTSYKRMTNKLCLSLVKFKSHKKYGF